jgi:hypothetical protein
MGKVEQNPHRLEIVMNSQDNRADSALNHTAIDAVIRKARADRAEAMRESMGELSLAFKRWVASFRPIRERAPHKGIWA